MSEQQKTYQGKQIFSHEPQLDEPESIKQSAEMFEQTQADPQEQDNFEHKQIFEQDLEFVPISSADDTLLMSQEQVLEEQLSKKSKSSWLLGFGLTSFTLLLGAQAADSIYTAYQANDWLNLAWSGLLGIGAGTGLIYLTKEWITLRRLKNQLDTQTKAGDLIRAQGIGQAQKFCRELAKDSGITLEHAGYDRWHQSVRSDHNDAEVLALYDAMVLKAQDDKAKQLIANYSGEAAVLVALSPLAVADLLLVGWRNLKLVQKIAQVYGVELGYWSRLKMLKLVFVNMALAGASELVADAGMHALSMDMAGKLSTRAAQGIGVGILTARLGLKAVDILRPLPWQEEKGLRLADMRRQISSKVLGLFKKKA